MSRYAFDLDGTLDVPAIAQLARDLHAAGHEIHILTAALADEGWMTIPAKEEKLRRLGVPYTQMHRPCFPTQEQCGHAKGEILKELGDPLFIDDSPLFHQLVPQHSSAARLWVVPQ